VHGLRFGMKRNERREQGTGQGQNEGSRGGASVAIEFTGVRVCTAAVTTAAARGSAVSSPEQNMKRNERREQGTGQATVCSRRPASNGERPEQPSDRHGRPSDTAKEASAEAGHHMQTKRARPHPRTRREARWCPS
jgi:hypothetical protein